MKNFRDCSTAEQQTCGALLRLCDEVVDDCRGRGESEALDHLLRLAATLQACAENLASGALDERQAVRVSQ